MPAQVSRLECIKRRVMAEIAPLLESKAAPAVASLLELK